MTESSSQSLPQGPANLQQLLQYPRHIVSRLVDDPELNRCLPLPCHSEHGAIAQGVRHDIRLYTRYSGMGTPEIVARFIEKEFMHRFAISEFITHEEAWDLKKPARKILLDLHDGVRPQHIFGDMMGMLQPDIAAAMSTLHDGNTSSWSDMKALLWAGGPAVIKSTSYCYIHKKECAFGTRGKRGAQLTMLVAGITCKDFSTANRHRRGVLGPSGRVLLVFLMEVKANLYDIVLTECVIEQDLAPVDELLSPMYDWCTWCWGPEDAGWWTVRPRRFCIFTLKQEFGGRFYFTGTFYMFKDVFGAQRHPDVDGSMFAASNPQGVAAEVVTEAGLDVVASQSQSVSRLDGAADVVNWESSLSGSKHARLQLYRFAFLEFHGYQFEDVCKLAPAEVRALVRCCLSEQKCDVVCDLESSPSWRASVGQAGATRWLPTLTASQSWLWMRLGRCITADEQLLSQGLCSANIAIPEGVTSTIMTPWADVWQSLSERERKDIIENAINAMVLLSLFGFVFRCLAPLGPPMMPCKDVHPEPTPASAQLSSHELPDRDASDNSQGRQNIPRLDDDLD